ncbi:MAG: hydroxymethylglutaryl-CoA lyase [Bacteroidota bacterium]|nr:hydroxymethylglutaryl-CoA lyase [Bacteroidota bacterium]
MQIKIIECPRDAMQGLHEFIPTESKIAYINALLRVGFDTIDFGSFVSPKAIPQLKDTAKVLSKLNLTDTKTKLLAIVANLRGAKEAVLHPEITYLGFPFSISETFQKKNTNKTIQEALETLKHIQDLCITEKKELVVYITMAFGNPYGDEHDIESIVLSVEQLNSIGIKIISMSDTVGIGNPKSIGEVFGSIIPSFPNIEFGLHLHTTPNTYYDKIDAAFTHGCRRFDSVMLGLGGCPMSACELVGNLSTESLLGYFESKHIEVPLNARFYHEALRKAQQTFPFV